MMGKEKLVSVTQEDWYMRATSYEEQAERWFLTDITKTLRFYVQALHCYERALEAPEGKPIGNYHILYNETRLLLQVYTEYAANSGYINILQYIKLNNLPGISNLIVSLPNIVDRFEEVQQCFQEEITWDFQFNMLTCYLSLLESMDTYNLTAENIVQLANKYVECTQILIAKAMEELQFNINQSPAKPRELTQSDEGPLNKSDRSDILICDNRDTTDEIDGSQRFEMTDQIDYETMADILNSGFKFIQALAELCITCRFDSLRGESRVNQAQINYLESISRAFLQQLNDIRSAVNSVGVLDLSQADISSMVIDALKLIDHGPSALEEYLYSVSPRTPDTLLAQVDLLQVILTCLDPVDVPSQWSICTLMNKVLVEVRAQFTDLRREISLNPAGGGALSRITFHLCDIYVDSSDNELIRYWIRRGSSGADDRTCQILLKNAKTLLVNGMRIAQKSCGLQENNVDKLKRNYVFKQVKIRLDALENGYLPMNQMRDEVQDLQDHPFYKNLALCQE